MRLTASEPGRPAQPDSHSILVTESGVALLGLQALRDRFGDIWPRWTGNRLPEALVPLIATPGTHALPDQNLAVQVEAAPRFQGMGLRRLTLRRLTPFDLLTTREREVARALAIGHSSKEVARNLGLAPATVRNQTQSIFQKLQVDNCAALSAMVMTARTRSTSAGTAKGWVRKAPTGIISHRCPSSPKEIPATSANVRCPAKNTPGSGPPVIDGHTRRSISRSTVSFKPNSSSNSRSRQASGVSSPSRPPPGKSHIPDQGKSARTSRRYVKRRPP